MTQSLEYPRWQEPLLAELLEFDPKQLCAKVMKAEDAIDKRIKKMEFAMDGKRELRLLHDGLSLIRQLREGVMPGHH
jgi:hypothetical protein